MSIIDLGFDKEVYAFELDDVLFPKQDYLLQVYYLFGSFYEFTEGTVKANDLALFMKKVFLIHGENEVFNATKEVFGIDEKYRENFERLRANAQIPLRLELFTDVRNFIINLLEKGKKVVILTKGNPVEQLNKLKFIDWGEDLIGKRDAIKIYFVDELRHRQMDPIEYLVDEYNVSREQVVLID